MNTLRSLILTGIFALSVFLVGLSLGLQLSPGHTRMPSAAPSSPDFPATVAALEEQLRAVEATVRSAYTPSPAVPQPSQPAGAPPPTPTLRAVTRATLLPQKETDVAAAIAREYLGGGEVVEVKHEKKYGTDVFEVKFKHGSEVYVDVQNRRILYAEIEPDDLNTSPTPTLLPTLPPTSTPIPAPPPTSTPAPPPKEDTKDEEEAPEEQKPEEQDTHEEDQDAKDKGEDENDKKQEKESHDEEPEKKDEHEEHEEKD